MRPLLATVAGTAGAVLAVASLTACSDSPDTLPLPAQTLRDQEKPLDGKSVTIGEVTYTALALRTKIISVSGSHADVLAKGQYVRVRIQLANHGGERHDFDLYKQLLVGTDGRTYKLSYDAMNVTRGVGSPFSIARDEVRDFDLYFDIPAKAGVKALRITGDPSSSNLAEQLKGGSVAGTKPTQDLVLKTK